MGRLSERAGAAFKACCAVIVHGVELASIVAIVTLTAIGVWSEPWGPPVVVAGLFALPWLLVRVIRGRWRAR